MDGAWPLRTEIPGSAVAPGSFRQCAGCVLIDMRVKNTDGSGVGCRSAHVDSKTAPQVVLATADRETRRGGRRARVSLAWIEPPMPTGSSVATATLSPVGGLPMCDKCVNQSDRARQIRMSRKSLNRALLVCLDARNADAVMKLLKSPVGTTKLYRNLVQRGYQLPRPTDEARFGRYAPWIEIQLRLDQPVTADDIRHWLLSRVGMIVERQAALDDFRSVLDLDIDITFTSGMLYRECRHLLFVNQLMSVVCERCPIPGGYKRPPDFEEGCDGYLERHGDVARLIDALIEHGLVSSLHEDDQIALYPHTYSSERFAAQIDRRRRRQVLVRRVLHRFIPRELVGLIESHTPCAFRSV